MKRILLGMTAWGDHLDTFFKYGLPSLMSEGNLPALCKEYEIGINIHTDKDGEEKLRHCDMPFMIYRDVTDEEKYHQLGRHQHKDLRAAKDAGADYHLLMPDFIYSEDCFSGILSAIKRGHKAIARLVVSTNQETISPHLNRHLTAKELATLSLLHIHPGIRHWLMNGIGCPNTHVLAWECENTLHMCSPHLSPVYIANNAIKIDTSNFPLDCILDRVIDGDVYCPKQDDGIVIIEMSPEGSRQPDERRVALDEFIRLFKWDTQESKKQLEIFNLQTIDPIDRTLLSREYWNEIDIFDQMAIVNGRMNGINYDQHAESSSTTDSQ